nr:P3 [Jujube associated badnavirus]
MSRSMRFGYPPVDSHDLPILPGDEDEEQLLAILTFTGDPQYLEPDPVYDTESSDDSFYDDSDSDEESTGPQPDNGLSCEHPWASDPCPAHAIWEENRSGNCPKAFWRSYQPPPSFDAPMPDPAQASWGPDFDDAPTFDPSPPVSPEGGGINTEACFSTRLENETLGEEDELFGHDLSYEPAQEPEPDWMMDHEFLAPNAYPKPNWDEWLATDISEEAESATPMEIQVTSINGVPHFEDFHPPDQSQECSTGTEVLHLSEEEGEAATTKTMAALTLDDDDDWSEYPRLRPTQLAAAVETALASSSTTTAMSPYRPPEDTMMGPPGYPPATARPSMPNPWSIPDYAARNAGRAHFQGGVPSEQWQLPSAQQVAGAMLVLPDDIGMYNDVISRWESITANLVDSKIWSDVTSRITFIENLLGEIEKKAFIQWRMMYPDEYQRLINIGDDTHNILSQIRRIITLEDPAAGSTIEQDQAYLDLERLSCEHMKDLIPYMNRYKVLAAKTGRLFINPELSEKFFRKMPALIGKHLEQRYNTVNPGNSVGVFPRIHFAYQELAEMCKQAQLQRGLKDLSFCSQIPLPGYYSPRKKYGLRKSKNYAGKPHKSHVRVIKKKYQHDRGRVRKCKCFICGKEGHFARECKNSYGNKERVAMLQELDLPDEYDIVSVDLNEPLSDAICSISEGEMATEQHCQAATMDFPGLESLFMLGPSEGYLVQVKVSDEILNCTHQWQMNEDVDAIYVKCLFCKYPTKKRMRLHCTLCHVTSCPVCSVPYLKVTIIPAPPAPKEFDERPLLREMTQYVTWLQTENDRLKAEIKELTGKKPREQTTDAVIDEELQKDLDELEAHDKGKESLNYLGEAIVCRASTDQKEYHPKRMINRLFNMKVTFHIPQVAPFTISAILDTGATACCIDKGSVPKEALEENSYTVFFNGINSRQGANWRLKGGQMQIGENKFRIPFTYSFDMNLGDGIQMIIGCNFIRGMQGGVRIEGQQVTFYKNLTTIETSLSAGACATECDPTVIADLAIFSAVPSNKRFLDKYKGILDRLKEQGFIGEDPLNHWEANGIKCHIDIINPDITIQDPPLKHVTPALKETFQKHIDALLKLGVIRESNSRHRTMAMIVKSGTTIDPITGKEQKGKERMVFNYRTLNDNTYKDQYSLPGINTILKKVGNAKIYSKFDLKSGFHQIAMDKESIPWTAFIVPQGLFEWLVMPFGLKNAPALFQRKMDHCFKGTEDFIAVYIDDVLIFSASEQEHHKHLQIMLDRCKKHGLILSPTKMVIAVPEVYFLGAVLGKQKLKLQPHIIQKIANFKDKDLQEKKGLRSWLGILNYARSYIPKLGAKLGPLYEKTSPHGDKRFKPSDWALVREIKAQIQQLPELDVAPIDAYIILETDGCMEGWGGVCKWKKAKADPRSTERVCAYANGKFPTVKSAIDAEIYACMETLNALKIHYLDKEEITLRTDCQAIISFYNKSAVNKPSRVRWLAFTDFITGTGVKINFEHIDGKHNVLADNLSRLVTPLLLDDSDSEQRLFVCQQVHSWLPVEVEEDRDQAQWRTLTSLMLSYSLQQIIAIGSANFTTGPCQQLNMIRSPRRPAPPLRSPKPVSLPHWRRCLKSYRPKPNISKCRQARTTIMGICSQGLPKTGKCSKRHVKNWKRRWLWTFLSKEAMVGHTHVPRVRVRQKLNNSVSGRSFKDTNVAVHVPPPLGNKDICLHS